MIPIKPKILRILLAQCEGIINIPSLDFLTGAESLFCGLQAPLFLPIGNDDFLTGIAFSTDGNTMFLGGDENKRIYQYDVPTSFVISSGVTLSTSFQINALDSTFPTDVTFDTDGGEMYVSSLGPNQDILQYTLNANFDLTNPPAGTSDKFDVSNEAGQPTGVTFGGLTPGSKMYVVDLDGDSIIQYNVPTPFDMSSIDNVDIIKSTLSFNVGSPQDMVFAPDGKTMFITNSDPSITQVSLSVAFDLTSTVTEVKVLDLTDLDNNPFGLTFSPDGLRLFFTGNENNGVFQIFLKTPFELP